MGRAACSCIFALTLSATACGGSDAPPEVVPDAGTDAGLAFTAPEIPWLAPDGTTSLELMRPCPSGWREVVHDSGATSCDPYPEDGAATCASGEAHFLGEPACATIGSACPTGDFADGLPDDGTVKFVRAGAMGGDGSRAAPFGRIADALAVATSGTTIALSRGNFDEVVSLRAGVALRGACVSATMISTSGSDPRPGVITIGGTGTAIRDLRIGASNRPGIFARGTTSQVTIEGVLVDGTTGSGIAVLNGANATASALVVRGTRPTAAGAGGRGIDLELATLELSRAVLDGNAEVGLFVGGTGTVFTMTDTVVRGTRPATGGAFGRGMNMQGGAQATLTRTLFEDNRDVGVFVGEPTTSITITDMIIRDTQARQFDGLYGRGLAVQNGATAVVSRLVVQRNYEIAVFVAGLASATFSDVLITETRGHRVVDAIGRALEVLDGAYAEVHRGIFEHSEEGGVVVESFDTRLLLEDVIVRDTMPQVTDGIGGRGIGVQFEATLETSRVLVQRNHEISLVVMEDARASLADTVIVDTMLDKSGFAGACAGAYQGSHLEVRRFLIARCGILGVQLAGDGAMDLHDGQVSDNQIGVNLQSSTFDIARLQDRVVYRNNERDLDTALLPVPDPSPPPAL